MGRTYAVTGDKILCDFRINDAYQGSVISAMVRKIHVNVQTQAPLDKIVIYKNEKPYHILNGENYWEANQSGHLTSLPGWQYHLSAQFCLPLAV